MKIPIGMWGPKRKETKKVSKSLWMTWIDIPLWELIITKKELLHLHKKQDMDVVSSNRVDWFIIFDQHHDKYVCQSNLKPSEPWFMLYSVQLKGTYLSDRIVALTSPA